MVVLVDPFGRRDTLDNPTKYTVRSAESFGEPVDIGIHAATVGGLSAGSVVTCCGADGRRPTGAKRPTRAAAPSSIGTVTDTTDAQVDSTGPLGGVAVVTGAGAGIGAAIAAALVEHGTRVVVSDIDADAVARTAADLGPNAVAVPGDAADLAVIERTVDTARERFGPVDLYVANAGVAGGVGLESTDAQWRSALEVNVMGQVRAARLLIPEWLERGAGYFLATASAAGLLTQIGSPTYSASKHASVAFAEWLSVTYGDRGIGVSCLCPMGVNTALLHSGFSDGNPDGAVAAAAVTTAGAVLEPKDVAREVIAGIQRGSFLILPHPEVLDMYRGKGADYERWLSGMRRYRRILEQGASAAGAE